MSNRARSPFASRWARKGAISSGWFCARASLWPPPAPERRPSWRAYCFSPHGRPALRRLALRSLHLRRRNRRAHRRRHRRQLHPCAARHAPRPDHYTPRRMTFGTAQDLSAQARYARPQLLLDSSKKLGAGSAPSAGFANPSEFQRIIPSAALGSGNHHDERSRTEFWSRERGFKIRPACHSDCGSLVPGQMETSNPLCHAVWSCPTRSTR
jgi:hypothetical protein